MSKLKQLFNKDLCTCFDKVTVRKKKKTTCSSAPFFFRLYPVNIQYCLSRNGAPMLLWPWGTFLVFCGNSCCSASTTIRYFSVSVHGEAQSQGNMTAVCLLHKKLGVTLVGTVCWRWYSRCEGTVNKRRNLWSLASKLFSSRRETPINLKQPQIASPTKLHLKYE